MPPRLDRQGGWKARYPEAALLAPVPRRMSARRGRNQRCFNGLPYLSVPTDSGGIPLTILRSPWVPTGKDSVPTDSGHSVRVLLDPAARLELGAWYGKPS